MQSVEDVVAAFIRGSGVGNVGGDVGDSHSRADNHAAAGIAHNTANLRLKAGLPPEQCRDESHQQNE